MTLPAHSEYSASAASRWRNCPGSQVLSLDKPDSQSAAAAEGTGLHALLEHCLLTGEAPHDIKKFAYLDNQVTVVMDLTEEQQDAVAKVIDQVEAVGGHVQAEMRVFYGNMIGVGDDVGFGTCDVTIMKGTAVHVMDAKFGRMHVEVVENDQMLCYSIGTVATLEMMGEEVTDIYMHVAQPRTHNTTEPWHITREELSEHIAAIRKDALRCETAKRGHARAKTDKQIARWVETYVTPGEAQCQWCRAKDTCPALAGIAEEVQVFAAAEFEDLTPDNRKFVLDNSALILKLIEACEESVTRDLLDGKPVEGYKMVEGRLGNRRWNKSEEEVEKELAIMFGEVVSSSDAFKTAPTLASPAQVEKVIKAGIKEANPDLKRKDLKPIEEATLVSLEELIERPAGKPALAKADDERRDWTPETSADEFENLED